MIKLLRNFLLFLISIMLGSILLPIGFVYAIIKTVILSIIKLDITVFISFVSDFFYAIAASIDQLGNVICAELFNDIMIKKGTYKFGHEDEKISSVLGKAKERNRLMLMGKWLSNLLDFIDKNHVIKSIDKTITYIMK